MTTTVSDYIQIVRAAGIERPRPRRRLILPTWEDWLTFAMVAVVFLSVVNSIESARWVPGMPSILLPSSVALLTGFFVGRTRLHELFAHVVALAVGFGIVTVQLVGFARGQTVSERWEDLRFRVADFIQVVRENGISTDNLPFVLLVLALTYVAAYFSAWAIFRWHNAWLGVIPGGVALLTNISYLPGQPATSFLFFLFGAILLVMRLHLLGKVREWQRTGTPYPAYLSLSFLNATFWVSVLLLLVIWAIPVGKKSNLFAQAWDRLANPVQAKSEDWGRFFAGVASKKPTGLHDFGATLAFHSSPSRSNREVARVTGDAPTRGDIPALRGVAYDIYTPTGWKIAPQDEERLAPSEVGPIGVGTDEANPLRRQVTIEVEAVSEQPILFSLGLPVEVNVASVREAGSGHESDVTALRPARPLDRGDRYLITGSVSIATERQLKSLGSDYPPGILERYLQLPDDLPDRVRELAIELAGGAATPYEKAEGIELYLRTVPLTPQVPPPPPGHDAIDYFLFDARQGFFDYHASAMAVLLRALGVPARVVTGFALDEFDRETGQFIIREANAYTWAEVYFPEAGWVAFSPSPDRPAISRSAAGAEGGGDQLLDREPDLPLGSGPRNRGGFVEPQPRNLDEELAADSSRANTWYILAGIAALVLLTGLGGRLLWERGLSGLPHAARIWEKTVRLASWVGLGPRPQQTPHEYARSLTSRLPDAVPMRTLADAYVRSRFGRKAETPADRSEVMSAWKSLRLRLLARLLRRRG